MPMTKEEKLDNEIMKARNLSFQGRWAEAKLKYENIIADLRGKPRVGKKTRD